MRKGRRFFNNMVLKSKDLIGIQYLTVDEIEEILTTAESFTEIAKRPIKKVPALRGKTVANLFFEPSTRTRASFELASKRLSADILNISVSSAGETYGETLTDIAKTIEAMNVDFVVVRHSMSGVPHLLAQKITSSVINAGDGSHEHPTQALIDLFTIRQLKGYIEGINVAIIGDISHSREAKSDIWALTKLGAKVTLIGPPTLIPQGIERLGVKVSNDMLEGLKDIDVIILTPVEMTEKHRYLLPGLREYARFFCLTRDRLNSAKNDCTVLHSGKLKRGIEIDPLIAEEVYSDILHQIENSIAVTMAVLYLLSFKHKST
jgi:aspartate carbamoyltransferase catalytic subunit